MADPTLTQLTASTSATATTTVSFTAQPATSLLILAVASDDYRTTSGAGRPESTGWTLINEQQTFLGHAIWYKLSNGSETSVQYTIGSAAVSAHWLGAATNVDTSSLLDVQNGQFAQSNGTTYTTPAVTPSAGRRLSVGSMGGSSGLSGFTGMSTWLNSYTEIGDVSTPNGSGTRDILGVAYLVLDGGVSTSTGATYSDIAQARTGIIAVFKGSAAPPPGPYAMLRPAVIAP